MIYGENVKIRQEKDPRVSVRSVGKAASESEEAPTEPCDAVLVRQEQGHNHVVVEFVASTGIGFRGLSL
jgi:hypothetical protein